MAVRVKEKGSGKVVDVAPAEASRGIQQGDYEPVEATLRVSKGGELGSVPARDFTQAIAEGWDLVDSEGEAKLKLQREEATAGSQALAAMEAAGSAVGGTWVEKQLGVSPERMAARREALGTGLSTAAEMAGGLGAIALTGGFSAAGRGVGALALRGAAEGAALGAGAEIDDSVLEGRDITAEHVAAAAGWGGLLGGATSAIVPGVVSAGVGLGKVGLKPIRSVLSKAAGVADDFSNGGAARLIADGRAARVARYTETTADDIQSAFGHKNPAEAKAWLDRIQDGQRVTETAADELRPLIEELRQTQQAVRIEHGAMRHIEDKLPRGQENLIQAAEAGRRELSFFSNRVSKALDDVDAGLLQSGVAPDLRRLSIMAKQAEVDIANATRGQTRTFAEEMGDYAYNPKKVAAATYRALNDLKREVFAVKQKWQGIAPTIEQKELRQLIEGDGGLYTHLKTHLEDDLWGKLGQAQQEVNLSAATAITQQQGLGRSASGKLLDPTLPIDNSDLLTIIKNSATYKGTTKTEQLLDALKARVDYFRTAKRQLELPPEVRAAIDKQETLVKRVEEVMNKHRARVNDVAALDRLDSGFSSSAVGMAIRTAATALGTALGGLVGGSVGAFIGYNAGKILSTNIGSARRLAVINARAMASQKQYGAAIGKFLHQISNGTTAIGRAAETAGRQVARATPVVARAAGGRDERLRSAIERTRLLTRNPQLLAAEVDKATAELEDVPRLKGVLAMKATQAALYLATVAPAGYQAPYSTRPPIYDPIALARFERTLEAVNEPYKAIARLADGTFSKEHADALRAVWPAIYAKAQEEILSALAEAEAGGKTIPLTVQTRLGVFVNARTTPFIPLPSPPVQIPAPAGPGKPPEYKPLSLATQTQQIGTVK